MLIIYTIALFLSSQSWALDLREIAEFQTLLKNKPVGERIAFWAEKFVGTPYDTDPLGEYVRKSAIVADERIDCMYHVFRSVELALSNTPTEAQEKALNLRFHTKGILQNSVVINYSDRFQYGIDMILSGKWGKDITENLGEITYIKGDRGLDKQKILLKKEVIKAVTKLQSGDIVFFIKDQEKRDVEEIVGHIGIIKIEDNNIYLIHASGQKKKSSVENKSGNEGEVKKVIFIDYLKSMKFIGIKVTRF